MMKRFLMAFVLFALVLVWNSFGVVTSNWSRVGSETFDSCRTTNVEYGSTLFNLAKYEKVVIEMHVADTQQTGYAADSTRGIWGIQPAFVTIDSAGTGLDTSYGMPIVLDTMDTASARTYVGYALQNYDGTITAGYSWVDTASVAGYMSQIKPVSKGKVVARFFRLFWAGLAGNNVGAYNKLRFVVHAELFQNTYEYEPNH